MATHELLAVRALRRAIHANRAFFQAAYEWAEADAMFDCGEFGGGMGADMEADARAGQIREYIARRFGLHPMELEGADMAANFYEIGCMMEGKRAREAK
jgi:hypothetical protein